MVLHTTLLQLSALKGCEDGLGEWIAARCGQYVPLCDDFIGGMFLFFLHIESVHLLELSKCAHNLMRQS